RRRIAMIAHRDHAVAGNAYRQVHPGAVRIGFAGVPGHAAAGGVGAVVGVAVDVAQRLGQRHAARVPAGTATAHAACHHDAGRTLTHVLARSATAIRFSAPLVGVVVHVRAVGVAAPGLPPVPVGVEARGTDVAAGLVVGAQIGVPLPGPAVGMLRKADVFFVAAPPVRDHLVLVGIVDGHQAPAGVAPLAGVERFVEIVVTGLVVV